MATRFKIEFGDHRHRRTGFLSNAARYPFVLDNKEWPSVEHYVYAQSFKGTPLESQLRCAPSSWHLQFLARGKRTSSEKDGRLIKSYEKPAFSRNLHYLYQKAIPNKFFQNQRIMERLLNTGNANLVDVTCPYTGTILEQIRTQCYQERFQKNFMYSKQELELSPDIKDVLYSSLTVEDYAIINGLINKAWENVKKTEQSCIYVEFVENVLLELYPKRAEFIIMLYQMRTPQMISQMHNFSKIVQQVYEIFRKQDPYQVYDLSGSYLISEVLRWHKMYASPNEASQFLYIVAPNFLTTTTEEFSPPQASYSRLPIDKASPDPAPPRNPVADIPPQVKDLISQLDPVHELLSQVKVSSDPDPPLTPVHELPPQVKDLISQLDPVHELPPPVKGLISQLDPVHELPPQVKGLISQLDPVHELPPQVKVSFDPEPPLDPVHELPPQVKDLTSQLDPVHGLPPQGKDLTSQLDPVHELPLQVKDLISQLDPVHELPPQSKGSSDPEPPLDPVADITPQGQGYLTSQLSPVPESTKSLEPAELQIEPPEISNRLEPAERKSLS